MRLVAIGMLASSLVLLMVPGAARATGSHRPLPHDLAGTLLDFTNNRGHQGIWSPSLHEYRDVYVYLPPGYDPNRRYPVMVWLHGIAEDETTFLGAGLHAFDAAMACGKLPPLIIAMPDGTLNGRHRLLGARPLWLNSNLGRFEDFLVDDLWPYLLEHFPIRPEREAHVLAGFSGGGAAAYRVAIRYREQFGICFAGSPPLNVRWMDCHGRYFANFDPDCWGWRTEVSGHSVVGRFYGVVTIRMGQLLYPLYGRGPQSLDALSRENVIELLDAYNVQPGDLSMLVAYGRRDQFNIDAQVESFLYRANERGLEVAVCYGPHDGHALRHSHQFLAEIIDWLAPQLGH
jgi:S-formylglutathione hydrolase FrmB